MKQWSILAAATWFVASVLGAAHAQEFPSRTLTVVVPYAPGASTDVVMRLVSQKVAARLGQPIVIENRGGGGGTVAALMVAKAQPDGHTLLMGNAGTHVINPATQTNLGYDPERDFVPVSGIMSFASILVVPAASKARTVAELIAAAGHAAMG